MDIPYGTIANKLIEIYQLKNSWKKPKEKGISFLLITMEERITVKAYINLKNGNVLMTQFPFLHIQFKTTISKKETVR
jgi:hypothetical protein